MRALLPLLALAIIGLWPDADERRVLSLKAALSRRSFARWLKHWNLS